MKNANFFELQQATDGGIFGWVVKVKENQPYYLLNDGSFLLGNLASIPATGFGFKTEHDAHQHACEYYTAHGKPYPYFPEFYKSQGNNHSRTPTAKIPPDDGGSQRMTF